MDWQINISRGIVTGYNEAFIIDTATRDALIEEDARSGDIIKPILRGRDIKRYRPEWDGHWLIVAKYGSYKTLSRLYPAVHTHLLQHETRLRARGQCRYSRGGVVKQQAEFPGQHHWLELDNNPKDEYLSNFEKEKLFWMDMSSSASFAYSTDPHFANNAVFLITGLQLKPLGAILNSRLSVWYMRHTARTTGMGLTIWHKTYVERIPIPDLSANHEGQLEELFDQILDALDTDPDTDTTHLEAEIDRLVYDLYGLTEEEIAAVEARVGG